MRTIKAYFKRQAKSIRISLFLVCSHSFYEVYANPIHHEVKACGAYIESLRKGVLSPVPPTSMCPVTQKFYLWKTLQAKDHSYSLKQFYDFLKVNKNWPKIKNLHTQGEKVALATSSPEEVLQWFELMPPLSGEAAAHHIHLLQAQRHFKKARELIPLYWQTKPFHTPAAEVAFLKKYQPTLTFQDHHKRLMRFGLRSNKEILKRMKNYLSQDYKKMIEAVLALIDHSSACQRFLNRIPKALKDHPLVVFHRIHWYLKKDQIQQAIILMEYAINQNMPKDHPEKWMALRLRLARESCQRNLYKTAYVLLKDNNLMKGVQASEAHFLAGWIAFRKLNNLNQALSHFKAFYKSVETPISQSKAAYWYGRVLDATNGHKSALQWYQISAQHAGTFYGQESQKILGHEKKTSLKALTPTITWQNIDQQEIVEYFSLLHLLETHKYEEEIFTFLTHLSKLVKTPSAQEALLKFAKKVAPHHLVLVSKMAGKNGTLLFREAYPKRTDLFKEQTYHQKLTSALFHSIIRQESGFNEQAISPVGAKGLMQLRPSVAKEIAKKIKLKYHENDLTKKPQTNTLIGAQFLSTLLHRFNGDIVLAIASYNAGEGRVQKWIKTYGDPRQPDVDTIDWIEMLPFEETRSYIHRVLEAIPLYEEHLKEE